MKADIRNHKGEYCPYRKILLCQEGYCNECQIFLNWCLNLWGDGEKHINWTDGRRWSSG